MVLNLYQLQKNDMPTIMKILHKSFKYTCSENFEAHC